MDPIAALHQASRTFGPDASSAKLALLDAIGHPGALKADQLSSLAGTLDFMRAYPDDRDVLARVHALAAALPAPEPLDYSYSFGSVSRLVRMQPGAIEIDWEEVTDESPLTAVLDLVLTPAEVQGLEDPGLSLREWFRATRSAPAESDLGRVVAAFERSSLGPRVVGHLYDSLELPLAYRARHSCQIEWPTSPVHPQRRPVDRGPTSLARAIRRPVAAPRRAPAGLIDVATEALCARRLEIYPLLHADPREVRLADCGGGLAIAFVGVQPEFRSPLETLYFFIVLKNGAPVAYGPIGVFMGCCEMGINLFPEFRGGEIRRIYAEFMRVLHHWLGVDNFFLTRYGMGEGNPDAIASGAFWFYRKLGFRPTNPAVEALARSEEARMAARPGHRSDRRMLHRLSHTEAVLDLSGGRFRPMDFPRLGLLASRAIGVRHGGDGGAAERAAAARVARALGVSPRGRALRAVAPVIGLLPDLDRWSAAERATLARAIQAKDAASEAAAARGFKRHRRLERALRELLAGSAG